MAFFMLISNYNHFAATNKIWSTIYNATTGRMELHSNPVALTVSQKSVPKQVSGKNRVKENNLMILLEKFSTLSSLPDSHLVTDFHYKYI